MVQFFSEDPARLADAVARLAVDLSRITAGAAPTATDLQDSPLLDCWAPAVVALPVLAGTVQAHPLLGTRPLIRTSPLFVCDRERGWARTLSRFYRLGASAQERASGPQA
jgi:hypothetical protein